MSTSEVENSLSAADSGSLMALSSREICFVLIEFKPTDLDDLQRMLSSSVEIASAHKGVVDVLVSHLVVICFGMIDGSPVAGYVSFIEALLSAFGGRVRITYAHSVGEVGNIGSRKRMSYSFVHPAFPKALADLASTPFGKANEVLEPYAV